MIAVGRFNEALSRRLAGVPSGFAANSPLEEDGFELVPLRWRLFWGLRGGGGNFGIVTSFEYQLHQVGPVLAGMVVHPMAKAEEVLRFYRDFCRGCPDEMVAAGALMTSPDGAPVAVIVVGYIGDLAAGEKAVAPLRKFGTPLADTIAPTSYVQLNTLFDAAFPYGGVYRYWKSSSFLKELGDDMLDIMIARSAKMLSPMSSVLFFHVHGAPTRIIGTPPPSGRVTTSGTTM